MFNVFGGHAPLQDLQADWLIRETPQCQGDFSSQGDSTCMTELLEAGGSSMNEDLQADWLIRGLYTRRNPSKLQEVETLLKKYEASDKIAFYKRVCQKYGDAPVVFASERREQRAVELIRDLYMRRSPAKAREVDELLKQYKGSREKFYQRVCAKYGEKPVDLAVDVESCSSSSSTACTRTPSTSDSSKKCTLCNSAYTGFGQVCFHCRKRGSRGSAQQCQQCEEYFQGFGNACHDCRELGEELMG